MSFRLGILLVLAAASTLRAADVTFDREISPIFFTHCTGCHHANDVAPMSLLTYKDARPWAASIKEAVLTRTMPPWKADPHFGKFSNDPTLTVAEIATIEKWVEQGAKEGNPKDLPTTPVYSTSWKIGKPDAIFAIPEHQLTKDGPDEYEYFIVPTNFKEDVWVQSAELIPGNRKIVHHAHVWFEMPPAPDSKPSDAKPGETKKSDPPTEYTKWLMVRDGKLTYIRLEAPVLDNGCLAEDNGNLPGRKLNDGSGPIASYLPGKGPDVYPLGTAKKIPAGALLKFQVHYSKVTHKPETDATSVGLIFAKEPPAQPAKRVDLSTYLFKIPAGDPHHEVSDCHTFDKDVYITTLTPHMHLRGGDMRFDVEYPDKRKETLLFVPHYNFNWQITYKLQEPKFIPKGTKLAVIAHFDNSANNPFNPDPTLDVRWGEASRKEMMDGWVEYLDAPLKTAPALSTSANLPTSVK
ncbi:MAG: thiol-disulfide isomerase [Acidobacteriota bacterium]|nr:thiol-disulfide isomerase [Acidobacteriota bacterium]